MPSVAWVAGSLVVRVYVVTPVVIYVVNGCSGCSVAHLAYRITGLDCLPYGLPLGTAVELGLGLVFGVALFAGDGVLRTTWATTY